MTTPAAEVTKSLDLPQLPSSLLPALLSVAAGESRIPQVRAGAAMSSREQAARGHMARELTQALVAGSREKHRRAGDKTH